MGSGLLISKAIVVSTSDVGATLKTFKVAL